MNRRTDIPCDKIHSSFKQKHISPRTKRRPNIGTGGILLSLAGILACNYFGTGLGRAVCHGLLIAALGTPSHKESPLRSRA